MNKKIISSFPIEPVNERAQKKIAKSLEPYGEGLKSFMWSLNWSTGNKIGDPSGFTAHFDATCKIAADIFHQNKMFSGTSIFKLPINVKTRNGDLFNRDFVTKNQTKIANDLVTKFPEYSTMHKHPSLKMLNKTKFTDSEGVEWDASLGTNGSFAGVFFSEEKKGYQYQESLWLVVQTNLPSVSDEFYDHISSLENTEETFKDLISDPVTKYANNLSRRNRGRLLANLASSLDLDIKFETDLQSRSVKECPLLTPTHENTTFVLTEDSSKNIVSYHAGTVNPSLCKTGVIVSENPFTGLYVLCGPKETHWSQVSSKLKVKEGMGSFPVNTGRSCDYQTTNHANIKGNVSEKMPIKQSSMCIATNAKDEPYFKLIDNFYRVRDVSFKQGEASLGYEHSWKEIAVRPLAVRVTSEEF